MLNGRTRISASIAALALTGSIGVAISGSQSPAQADQSKISKIRDRVNALDHQAEQASEAYNSARIQMKALKAELGSMRADQKRQGSQLDGVRTDVRNSVIAQYQSQTLGNAGGLLQANPDDFLNQVSTDSTVGDLQDNLLSSYGDEVKAYNIRRDQTQKRIAKIAQLNTQLAQDKKAANSKYAQAKGILDHLEAKQRQEILSRGASVRPGDIQASGRAAAAVHYAMAQVGKAYVWGAAGPDAFDCSGLTMAAWAQAGVSLPHSAAAQYDMGTHIPESELQPGDLVFYYSPISHVGMYIGNGMIVNAENPSVGVKVAPVNMMPYAGAVRPG
ncbi:MAG: C40 family peptidase [Nocardioidaceae bacterium]|nr:C40 family peptidase [Nocardioidaceae bacterium]MCL2615008.1 C40 family peptidase [Nocardioidaceae bacterium]